MIEERFYLPIWIDLSGRNDIDSGILYCKETFKMMVPMNFIQSNECMHHIIPIDWIINLDLIFIQLDLKDRVH